MFYPDSFPKHSIETLINILTMQRLNYACHRLENTSDSITNICLDSGFESQRTF